MPRFFQAVLLLSGMIIGAGMFAIPFSFVAAGFWVGTGELVVLSLVVLAIHLLYVEIVLATPGFHRMPGYTRIYLGRGSALLSWASSLFGTMGTLLAYLAIGALFLHTVFSAIAPDLSVVFWACALAGLVAFIVWFPLKQESAINAVLTVFEIAFIAILSFVLLPSVSLTHLNIPVPDFHAASVMVPYGVLLFALSGASVIPDLVTVVGRNKRRVRMCVVIGSLIPPLLYFLFALGVVGVSGSMTTNEAIAGLASMLGTKIVFFASIAGFFAVLTSFIALSASFRAMLSLDLALPSRAAWAVASSIPLALYLAGFQNFVAIIGAVGVFAFGVDGVLFFLMGRKIRGKTGARGMIPSWAGYAILVVIAVGVVAELLRIVQ